MKTFFRILGYSPNLTSRFFWFFVFSTIGVLFSAVTIVAVMPLLEVIRGQASSPTAIRTSMELAKLLRKGPEPLEEAAVCVSHARAAVTCPAVA